jgi:hypothetical protein
VRGRPDHDDLQLPYANEQRTGNADEVWNIFGVALIIAALDGTKQFGLRRCSWGVAGITAEGDLAICAFGAGSLRRGAGGCYLFGYTRWRNWAAVNR